MFNIQKLLQFFKSSQRVSGNTADSPRDFVCRVLHIIFLYLWAVTKLKQRSARC